MTRAARAATVRGRTMRPVDPEQAEREARFRGLVEVCNDLMQCVDPRGVVLYVNPAWLRTLGRAEVDVVDRGVKVGEDARHADHARATRIAHCERHRFKVIGPQNERALARHVHSTCHARRKID